MNDMRGTLIDVLQSRPIFSLWVQKTLTPPRLEPLTSRPMAKLTTNLAKVT